MNTKNRPRRIGGAFALISYIILILCGCGMEDISIPGISESREPAAVEKLDLPEEEPVSAPAPKPVMQDVTEEVMKEVETPAEETVSEDVTEYEPVTIIFAGDMNFDRRYANMNALAGRGGEITEALDEDIRNAISCGDPSLIFRDVIEKDDLANAYPVSTFQVDARITNLAKRLLKSSLPVNIMIHGPAGTGKTEYARALAKECGLECFFFRNESELMEDSGKHPLLRLDAFVGMDDPNRVLVVDEAESILSCADGGFYDISESCLKKGSVNRMIDGCKAKVIWILNDVETVDKTALRRMTYSISMPRFSPEYIRRLVCARLEEENLPPHVSRRVAQLAEKYKVSLATLDNILKALKCSGCM